MPIRLSLLCSVERCFKPVRGVDRLMYGNLRDLIHRLCSAWIGSGHSHFDRDDVSVGIAQYDGLLMIRLADPDSSHPNSVLPIQVLETLSLTDINHVQLM